MTDDPTNNSEPLAFAEPARRQLAGRLWRLVLKELREILRDRRTIITLVVMPILIYPLLAVVFQRFLLTSLSCRCRKSSTSIGVDSEMSAGVLSKQINAGGALLAQREDASEAGQYISASQPAVGQIASFVQISVTPMTTHRRHSNLSWR